MPAYADLLRDEEIWAMLIRLLVGEHLLKQVRDLATTRLRHAPQTLGEARLVHRPYLV